MSLKGWAFSDRYQLHAENLLYGLATITDLSVELAVPQIDSWKARMISRIKENKEEISRTILKYKEFFDAQGFSCPLTKQFQITLRKGFPSINPFVDTLLMCEMSTGALMGVHDLDKIEGLLLFDVMESAETYAGMRGPVLTKVGEIVARDNAGVIFSYFQGADNRTCISRETKNVVYFAFGAPGIPRSTLEQALEKATDILGPVASASAYEIKSSR